MNVQRTIIFAALLHFFLLISGQEPTLSNVPVPSGNSTTAPEMLTTSDPSAMTEAISDKHESAATNKAPGTLKSYDPSLLNEINFSDSEGSDTAATKQEEFPGKFKIGDYILMDDQNNLIIYFNCLGSIVEKNCALFYRKGKMDSTNLSLVGHVKDYYLNDTLALDGYLKNGLLNGPAIYYHENGRVRSKGRYRDNRRTGVWTYFYDNGNPEKIINIVQGYPFIVSYYQRNGRQPVVQGNGKYKGKFLIYKSCSPLLISGRVVEGKMHGKWKIYVELNKQKVATEYYENGKFLKGISGDRTYNEQPLININSYSPYEYLLWTENITGCPDENFQVLNYMGQDVHEQFYPALLDSLSPLVSGKLGDQWLIAGIHIARNSLAHSVSIKSSIDDKDTEAKIYSILKSMIHFSIIQENGVASESNYFFTILFRNDTVIIPAYLYYNEIQKSLPKLQEAEDDS